MFLVQFVFEHPDARWPYARTFKAPADFKLSDASEAVVRLLEVAPRGAKVTTITLRPCFWVQAAAGSYGWIDEVFDDAEKALGSWDPAAAPVVAGEVPA